MELVLVISLLSFETACSNSLCQPPSPAHSAAHLQGHVAFTTLTVLFGCPTTHIASFPISSSLTYRVPYPCASRELYEPSWGHTSLFRIVPSAHTLVRWVDENAFASIMQARPCPIFGRPVRHGDGSLRLRPDTSPQTLQTPPHGGRPVLRLSFSTEYELRCHPLAVSIVSNFVPV
jgi:hypothetical protein